MSDSDRAAPDGTPTRDYDYELVPEFQCDNCGRVTLTMLCGCEAASPRECGRIWFVRDPSADLCTRCHHERAVASGCATWDGPVCNSCSYLARPKDAKPGAPGGEAAA